MENPARRVQPTVMHAMVSMNNAHPTIIRDSLPCHGVSSYGKNIAQVRY